MNRRIRSVDARQIKRIEAVHGGFPYQRLYAVGCLFLAAKAVLFILNQVIYSDFQDVGNSPVGINPSFTLAGLNLRDIRL